MSLNPFNKSPDWKPTKEDFKQSIFQETREMEQVPKLMHSLIVQAYMAGEKAAQEGKGETDTTKLAAVGAIGFMLAFMLIKMELIPI